jgi:hypothetical protein
MSKNQNHDDQCVWPGCRRENAVIWLKRPVCGKHWLEVCALQERHDYDTLARKLKVELPQ